MKTTDDPARGLVPKSQPAPALLASRFASLPALPPAPDGLGEEIVGPVRDVIARAAADGITLDQLLARLRHRVTADDIAPRLQGQLGAAMLDGLMRGIVSEREKRN